MKKTRQIIMLAFATSLVFSFLYIAFLKTCSHHFVNQSLYVLQLGVYGETKNLSEACNQMKQHEIAYFVYEQDHQSYLIAAIDSNLDSMNDLKAKLVNKNISYVIKKISYRDHYIDDLLLKKDYQQILERMKYENNKVTEE